MPFDRHAKLALIIACIALLLSSVGFRYAVGALNIYLRKEPVELRGSFAAIPSTLGSWKQLGEDTQLDDAILAELGTTDTISRTYIYDSDQPSAREASPQRGGPASSRKPRANTVLSVHVAYYTGLVDAVPHIPDRCFVAAGLEPQGRPQEIPLHVTRSEWKHDAGPPNLATAQSYEYVEYRHPFTNQLMSIRMPVGDLALRVTEFASKTQPGIRIFGGFFFIANGRAASSPEQIRLLAFMPSERAAYYCKVQFVLAGPSVEASTFTDTVADFLDSFLPELMLRLPDWQEVERRSAAGVQPPAISP